MVCPGAILLCAVFTAGCAERSETTHSARPEPAATPAGQPSKAAAAPAPSPLSGTTWRLVEIQSMDDAAGTIRADDPARYTMRLGADGRVTMVLNCNRAMGSWSAEASADPHNGRFEFGPLAGTRALCPPPSLDERVVSQAQLVRGYALKDGKLHLSLKADGGIYAWEPLTEESYRADPDRGLEKAILQAVPEYTRHVVDVAGGTGGGRYVYGRVDLNGDGREEVFVYLLGSIFCGTGGCNLLLLTPSGEGYALVNNFPISRLPIVVASTRGEGWSDIFRLESGGGARASYVRHAFDGKRYVEKERTSTDKAPEGMRYLAGELTFQKGIPLEPDN
jgi:heat shock protein HslJ